MLLRTLVPKFRRAYRPHHRCLTSESNRGKLDKIFRLVDDICSANQINLRRRQTYVNSKTVALYDSFCSEYELLDGEDVQYQKLEILRYLYNKHGHQKNEIISSINTCLDSQNDDQQFLLAADRLHNVASCPTYVHFLRNVGQLKRGAKFLSALRADLLHYLSFDRAVNVPPGFQIQQDDICRLKILNGHLLNILCSWFNPGQLYIKPITWLSSCELVEKIAKYEAVHKFKSWSDAKKRLGPYRRCFALMHPSMKDEPLVLLYVALTKNIECKVKDITDHNISIDEIEDESKINTAMFYSISSTQKGLHGVDLGNIIIKSVAKELAYEFPKLKSFCTLSPIPQFCDWLCSEINFVLKSRNSERQGISKFLHQHFDGGETKLEQFKQSLISLDWINDNRGADHYRLVLMPLCAHYLHKVKRRGLVYDPVENFHLKNGAEIYRLNWLAHKSTKILRESCGIMVNYRYSLDECDKNAENYLTQSAIKCSDIFLADVQ